MTPFTGKW